MQTDTEIMEMHRRVDALVAADHAAEYAKAPVCWSCKQKILPPQRMSGDMCQICAYGDEVYETHSEEE
jgi:hypothetical protein